MSETDLTQTTTTQMKTGVPDYSVSQKTIDEAQGLSENYWYNSNWPTYLGYYKQIPELKKAVDALACWVAGKGWKTNDLRMQMTLEEVRGWGEDSFDSVLQNMIIVKKVNGDSYAEIIKDSEINMLINLKPLNPSNIRHVVNEKGIITRYDVWDGKEWKKKKVDQIFHISNDRIANEIHGVSVVEACKWVIDARNEAMTDWRRILHRSTIRVLEIDSDDPTTFTTVRNQYKEAIKNGEVLLLPKQKEGGFQDLAPPPAATFMDWIQYLENFFYQAVGIPKIILGGAAEYTEASSKVGYLTFEQVYAAEQRLLEQDLWNQLFIDLEFERPVSLKEDIVSSEAANTGQVGFQPNEMMAGVTRNE
jgi:hypothetical protein